MKNVKGTPIEPRVQGPIRPGSWPVKVELSVERKGRKSKVKGEIGLTVETNNLYTIIRVGDTEIFFDREDGRWLGTRHASGIHHTDPSGVKAPPKQPRPRRRK